MQEVRNRQSECAMVETDSPGNRVTAGLLIQPVPRGGGGLLYRELG